MVDVVCNLYTYGTTGKAKGAMLTHNNLLSNTSDQETAVAGEPHGLQGEIPATYISLKEGHKTDTTKEHKF